MSYLRLNIALIISIFFIQVSFAQEDEEVKIFSNTEGIKQEKITFLESEGYEITIELINRKYSPKTIKKIKRKYKISKKTESLVDVWFEPIHTLFRLEEALSDNVKRTDILYLFAADNAKTKVISFSTLLDRDTVLEQLFVNRIWKNDLPDSLFIKQEVTSIEFVDRMIKLGPACHWMSVHNIQCPHLGQISWSELHDSVRAETLTNKQIAVTQNKRIGAFKSNEIVSVIFEGIETTAKRYTYQFKVPRLIMGGSNILIIYYITQKVRGKYISCVMSYYTDDVNTPGLPPLINEVMELNGS